MTFHDLNFGTMQHPRTVSPGQRGKGPKALAACPGFASLARGAGEREALDRALRQTLPSPLREQARFADLRNERLVFVVSSPAWAARLRFQQAQILAAARAIDLRASSVTVKVAPPPPAEVPPDRMKPLSPAAASHLKAAAATLRDPALRDLFLDLASLADTADSPAPDSSST